MKLSVQKKLAASVLKTSKHKIVFDPERLEDVKEAITKTDIRGLMSEGAIKKIPKKGTSKARIRERINQRKKGLRKGESTKKGTKNARLKRKDSWMNKIRTQRSFLKELKEKKIISNKTYSELYLKLKGNFFRSKRHIKIYLEDHNLILTK